MSSKEFVMLLHFFQEDLRLNAAGYSDVRERTFICDGQLYAFQQVSFPAPMDMVTEDFFANISILFNLINLAIDRVTPPMLLLFIFQILR